MIMMMDWCRLWETTEKAVREKRFPETAHQLASSQQQQQQETIPIFL
jgi:hypothetical protein